MSFETTRRGFLGAGAAICALSTSRADAAPPQAPAAFKLGVASISFLKFPRERAIAMTRALDVHFINIKFVHLALDITPEQIRAARAEFDTAGLTVLGGGLIPFDKEDEADIRHKFEYAKLAGFPLIVAGPTHSTLPMLEKYVREYNIRLAVHNHGPEDQQFPTPQSALAAIQGMDPRVGLCVDVGHTLRAGADPVASLAEAGPRLFDIHMKDLQKNAKWEACPVGDGLMPVTAMFRQLRKQGYAGGVMLEYETDEDNPFPGMQKSFAYMRGVLAGMSG
jgi:sugar phosphate isomerase/epimerase